MSGHATIKEIEQLSAIEKKLRIMPNNSALLLQKAILLYEPFHQTEEAILLFEHIIQGDPLNVDAYFWLAECVSDHNANYPRAEQLLKKALELDAQRADCTMLLASVLSELDRDKKDIEFYLRKALELEPSWISPRIMLAGHLFKNKEYVQAKYEVEQTLKYILPEIPVVTDAITEHYEKKVTGRYYPENKNICLELLMQIKPFLN